MKHKDAKPLGRRGKGVKEMKQVEIPRQSAREIQRKLVDTMIGILEGRIDTDEALLVGMVAEEQLLMLEKERSRVEEDRESPGAKASDKGRQDAGGTKDGAKRWVN